MLHSCCFAGPVLPAGTARGFLQSVGGVPCYVADEKGALADSSTPCLVMAPDVFGISQHARLLADEMNRRSGGQPVVLVDYFEGTALSATVMECLLPFSMPALPGAPPRSLLGKACAFFGAVRAFLSVLPTLLPFVWRHLLPSRKAAKLPLVGAVAAELCGEGGERKLGLVGYCYGGDAALHFNALPGSRFGATAVAHGKVTLSQVGALLRPALFVCADNDFAFPERRVLQAEALVRARPDYSEARFRFRRYPGTYHGFAIRGDERNEVVENAKGAALDEAIDFFKMALL
jgi:dienelactone hydrolase